MTTPTCPADLTTHAIFAVDFQPDSVQLDPVPFHSLESAVNGLPTVAASLSPRGYAVVWERVTFTHPDPFEDDWEPTDHEVDPLASLTMQTGFPSLL